LCLGSPDRAPKDDLIVGAYYFDGWRNNPNHLTRSLTDSFAYRKPVWGWNSHGQMDREIRLAAGAGINYFSFCWYLRGNDEAGYKLDKYNQGLFEFDRKKGLGLMRFSILVANHEGSEISPGNWELASRLWLELFKKTYYLKVGGNPIITFFSIRSLVAQFGSVEKVNTAFKELKAKAVKAGFSGVKIAICVGSGTNECRQAVEAGADVLTGYNHAYEGIETERMAYPYEVLRRNSELTWDKIASFQLPVIPAVTLNWDPRPWSYGNALLSKSHWFTGYGASTCEESIRSVRIWLRNHRARNGELQMAVIYAWNEYGEGAWLTPSGSDSLLNGVKAGLAK